MENKLDDQYKERLGKVLVEGSHLMDRTGTGVKYVLGLEPIRVDLQEGFPCSTLRKLAFKPQVQELLWMVKGSVNSNDIKGVAKKWWNPFAKKDGDLGRTYGEQLRKARRLDYKNKPVEVDQLLNVVSDIADNPNSRRLCISTWDYNDMRYTQLPCCHGSMIQFAVRDNIFLDLSTYNRSQDLILGTPHNIILYSLLLAMTAHHAGFIPGQYVHQFGHAHVYNDHIEGAMKLLDKTSLELPELKMNYKDSLFDYRVEDFELMGYVYDEEVYDFKMSV